jgi:hypothetical protein
VVCELYKLETALNLVLVQSLERVHTLQVMASHNVPYLLARHKSTVSQVSTEGGED